MLKIPAGFQFYIHSLSMLILEMSLYTNLKIPSIRIKEQAYQTLVRTLVEYASTVWNPYTKTEINKIEAVKRRAARYVVNNQRNRSSVSNMHQTQMETFGKQEKRCKTDDDVQN
jgi:hypothetical protein